MQLKRPAGHRWRRVPEASDSGLALLLAVLIGVVLIAAASALLAVQLSGRRSGASASNRDLAEAAASTGVSRIEAQLNAASGDYRYLWEVPSSSWPAAATAAGGSTIRPLLSQPCSFKPLDPSVLAVLQGGTVGGERQDGVAVPITSRYSLRSYSKNNSLDWTMQVEGVSERQPNSGAIFARSLLSRRFEVSNIGVPRIGNWEDWAVIAAKEMDLGPTRLRNGDDTGTGIGLVQLVLDDSNSSIRSSFAASNSCDSDALMARVNASDGSLSGRIWPTLYSPSALPGNGWFEVNTVIDADPSTANERTWQCDDTGCNYKDAQLSGNNIILPQSKLCANNSANRACEIRVFSIELASRTLLVEAQDRPVILRLRSNGSYIKLASSAKICAVRVGSTTCYSGEPQRLVILGTAPDASTGCADTTSTGQSYLSIERDSLPEALVVLPGSTFRLTKPATLRGLVWANRICASPGLTLLSQVGSDSVLKRANSTWLFPANATAGRGLIRARATSSDPYQPWQ